MRTIWQNHILTPPQGTSPPHPRRILDPPVNSPVQQLSQKLIVTVEALCNNNWIVVSGQLKKLLVVFS